MTSEKIIKLINNPQAIAITDIIELDSILLKHPYFQIGQLLITKALLNTDNIRYNQQLKKAAAYSLERKKLFNLISLNNTNKTKKKITKEVEKSSLKEKLEIGKALKFDETENHSFSEWLTLVSIKKIERKKKVNLVDNFLKKKVRIYKPKKEAFFKATDAAKDSLIENKGLVTPTLARVYLEQGHYGKAILAYEKLILKYPNKSGFFATQLKLITKLNNK